MRKFLKGPFAVLMTPFKDNKLDEEVFIKQIKRVNGTGVSGFVVNGSTAEFIQLSIEEQKRAIELVSIYKDADKKLIASACTGNVVDTVDIAKYAKSVGADAILVCAPYYFTYPVNEKKQYFIDVANNSPLPVILYNIPFFTQEIELKTVYELFDHKNIIGTKDSSANMKRLMHQLDVAKDKNVAVLTGTDDILYSALFAGCVGSFTAFAAIYPNEISELYSAMDKGDYKRAKEIQDWFMPQLREADSKTFPFGYKELLGKVMGEKIGNKEI
ncbi:MAG: dihydrodipicolinate synthase family protein [Clostridia bacterium]|jgi:dihydrodipicolinate synthase/N-acetylneuraminate lyase|nr:dihydrodipicolinate synthase family protein [Clostridia bacterium]